MSIQERLQMVLKMHNLTPSAFADKLGVQRSNISHVLSGRNKPSLDLLEKIVIAFPRVNAHWLITGNMSTMAQQEKVIDQKEGPSTEIKQEDKSNNLSIVTKIVEFYKDGTFKEFTPKKQ